MDRTGNWMEGAFFGLHYDLHASAQDQGLGARLTAKHLAEQLAKVRCEWIQCDCKGHPGYTSWPTQTGSTAPGLARDMLAIHREVTRALGLKLGVHYSGVWDSRAIELHPDWAVIGPDGRPDPNQTCRLSPYLEELLIPQLLEIIDRYDVDGFWIDGENWACTPCWCHRCQEEFRRRTGSEAPRSAEEPGWQEWLAFHRALFEGYVRRYVEAVHNRKPGCVITSNWLYTARQPDPVAVPVDYLSGDFDWAYGANRAALEGRIMDARGLPWNLMAWGFTKSGEMRASPPWTMKPSLHLCQEVAEVLALGGGVMIYDTPERDGRLVPWHQEILAAVSSFCHERKELSFRTESLPQAAILHLASTYYRHNQPLFNYGTAMQPIEGALHALLECHWSTDVLPEDAALARMRRYALLVLPEQESLSPQMQQALAEYVAGGGCLIMSGAHLAREFGNWLGLEPDGEPLPQAILPTPDGRSVTLSGPWQPVRLRGAGALVPHLSGRDPEQDKTEVPAITLTCRGQGRVLAAHGPLFRDYFLGHYPLLRSLIRSLLAEHAPAPLVQVMGPPWVELVLRRKGQAVVIHLINRGAAEALGPNRVVVEHLPPARELELLVRWDAPLARVLVAPAETAISWQQEDGAVRLRVPELAVHCAIALEPR